MHGLPDEPVEVLRNVNARVAAVMPAAAGGVPVTCRLSLSTGRRSKMTIACIQEDEIA